MWEERIASSGNWNDRFSPVEQGKAVDAVSLLKEVIDWWGKRARLERFVCMENNYRGGQMCTYEYRCEAVFGATETS